MMGTRSGGGWWPQTFVVLHGGFVCVLIANVVDAALVPELGQFALINPTGIEQLLALKLSQLSLSFSSLAGPWWLSAIAAPLTPPIAQRAAASRRLPSIRVLHYMGTNFGMTGVETFILQLCAAQKRAGLVASIAMDLSKREEMRGIAAGLGIDLHDLPARRPIDRHLPRKLGTALLRARRVQALRRMLGNADVLHIQAVGISCLDGFVAARLARTRALVVTHHGTLSWFAGQRDWLSDATLWIEKRLASCVVMPYAAAAAELVAEGIPEQRTSVIPFCVDESLFSGSAAWPATGELTLLMAARMYPGKGQLQLLAALAGLLPRYPKLRALLIGDGPTRPEVEAEIDRLGLRSAVTCKGRVDHREIPALMRTAHLIVLPTYMTGEMFPLCLIEGMALGLPAIATHVAGIPEIIADGETGILVEPRDVRALAHAITRFLEDPNFYARARQSAVTRFHSRFTATAVAKSYLEHYRAALLQGHVAR